MDPPLILNHMCYFCCPLHMGGLLNGFLFQIGSNVAVSFQRPVVEEFVVKEEFPLYLCIAIFVTHLNILSHLIISTYLL